MQVSTEWANFHHGFCTHGEVKHPVQLEAELPHLILFSPWTSAGVAWPWAGDSEALLCVHIISVRSNGRASSRIEKVLPEDSDADWEVSSSEDLESSGQFSQLCMQNFPACLTWACTTESFPHLCPKISARIPQGNRSLILPSHPAGCIQGWKRKGSALLGYNDSSQEDSLASRRVWPSYLASMCSMRPGSCYVHIPGRWPRGRPAVVMSLWWTQVQRPI